MAAISGSSSPARIELDVVFPRNATYNTMTTPPIVLAMQNAPTASFFDYDLSWNLESDSFFYLSSTFNTYNFGKKFNYTSGDTAVLLDSAPFGQELDAGHYTLSWELSTSHCTHEGSETIIETSNVASGTLYFTVVDDKSGADYGLSECPGYLGSFAAKSATDTCPEVIEDESEPQPCDAKMKDDQIKCVESYLSGETDMEICTSAFDDIESGDKVEWKYADEARHANDHAAGSSDQADPDNSSSSSNEDKPDETEDSSEDSDSLATTIRPNFVCPALAIVAVSFFL
ncbi:hypothetical protein N7530_008813 [Penicillium desertorum]|uniref:DUF7136 domain-containing protein n=1 Tax=Penicillium desertorum TaxID=1303715 RepID=A0A9X0BL78_9EURO|nr:hypothetical protein N7530_008813 [Penicillium desertorum]